MLTIHLSVQVHFFGISAELLGFWQKFSNCVTWKCKIEC